MLTLEGFCSAIGSQIPKSVSGLAWEIITRLWPWYWLGIILLLGAWIFFEIKTRYGNAHYNSKNGFSPPFNSFVGSGTYLGLQALVYLLFTLIFGDAAYCIPWSYAMHLIVFASTGHILHEIGFWPELRIFKTQRPKWKKKKRF